MSFPTGLVNLGNTCYLNAAFQCIARSNELCAFFLPLGPPREDSLVYRIAQILEAFASTEKGTTRQAVKPSGLIHVLQTKMGSWMQIRQQNDIHEFLLFLFQKIGEEIGKPLPPKRVVLSDTLSAYAQVGVACDHAWNQSHGKEWSPIVDMVYGQSISQVLCGNPACQKIHHNMEPFLMLELPITTDLKTSIKAYMQQGSTDAGAWKCDGCHQRAPSACSAKLWRLPNFVMICLKRFTYTPDGRLSKVGGDMSIPATLVDLDPYLLGPAILPGEDYGLVAVAHHIGHPNNGHYFASVREEDGRWYRIDDDLIRLYPDPLPSFRDAYVLFYHARPTSSGATRRVPADV